MRHLLLTLTLLCSPVFGADHIWIEGESPTHLPAALKQADGVQDVKSGTGYAAEGWGNTTMISAGQIMHINMSGGQVEKYLPDEGLIFAYEFTVSNSAKHEIWARIAYEFARSEFDWRLNNGEWHSVSPLTPTQNIQPIQTWNELAWLQLDTSKLDAGKHTLYFRHAKKVTEVKGKPKTQRILAGLDAICISATPFQPAGKWQPGVDHRSDKDKAAEKHVFAINDQTGTDGRAWTRLDGLWQYAAWDENSFPIAEETRCAGVSALPDLQALRWFGYQAPKARVAELPEQDFCHRYLLRSKVDVPASAAGKGFFIDVQRSTFIISVFVNGAFIDTTKVFHAPWQMDLSQHIKAGSVNEIVFVVKDPYYSLNPAGDESTAGMGSRKYWNIPRDFLMRNQGIGAKHDYPLAADARTGILEPASFVICGGIYTNDAFIKTSVKHKNIGVDLEIQNPQDQVVDLTVQQQVIPWNQGQGGEAVLTLPAQSIQIAANSSATLNAEAAWENPHLWFPDDPYLYWLETVLVHNGKEIDRKRTRFGFREWDWSTHMFKLNGIKWPMWADTQRAATPEKHIELSKKSNVNQLRYWSAHGWGPMTRREALNYFDETGMLVRSSGTFDGQVANYGGGLREPDMSKEPDQRGRRPLKAKTHFFDNWREQMTAWIKEERNHASIYIWSVENEIAYINVNNLGQYREVEPELTKGVEHVMALDPTRPGMVDGGNCLRDESLPVNGAHYTEFMNSDFRDFPDMAYKRDHFYDKDRPQRGAWRMVPDRPIMKGEVYFANGYSTERFATIGGDQCFIGTGQTMAARGLWAKMLSEGYRWAEVSSFHFWLGNAERQYWNSWSPVAVFCKQWNWTWGSGASISRDCKVFNSTQHSDPITVQWSFDVDGQNIAKGSKEHTVAPGEAEPFQINFTCPAVDKLSTGTFTLTATRNGKQVFTDSKPVRLLAAQSIAKPHLNGQTIAVYDPQGSCTAQLLKRDITFTTVTDYNSVPDSADIIIVGSNAIPADRSTDPRWLAYAAAGKKVLILDQAYPLSYKAIPGDMTVTPYVGRFGFSQDLSHPIFHGLTQADFFTWGNDHIVYRNVYRKGTQGGRSLFQCDNNLSCSAVFESQPNNGLFILCQLALDKKLANEAVAQQVFNNLLNYAAAYKPLRKASQIALAADDKRSTLLKTLQLEHSQFADIPTALKSDNILIIDASPENLKTIAAHKSALDSFCNNGGWLVLWGLTPEGLADYNTIIGHPHAIRRFGKERVILKYPTSKYAAGLTLRDVVMDTGKKMYPWMALKTPDEDAIQWVVDHDDIAPFCAFPKPTELGKPSDDNPGIDHWPRNMVNGFTSDDNWAFTYTVIMDRGDSRRFKLTLPKEEELISLKIRPSKIYHPISKINIYFDDDPTPITAEIPVRENPIVEDIPISGRKAKTITLEIAEWTERGDKNIVVVDNIWLQVKRSDEYTQRTHSLLNIGALMVYERGQGGIVLNQINILDQEQNPDNTQKKATIVRTVLNNIGAIFSGSQTEVDDQRYATQAVKIDDSTFNAYVHQRGKPSWFAGGDIEAIPVGNKQYAGTEFFLSDFSTSPVPSAFMLAGEGSSTKDRVIQDIQVNTKADALFFLHTFQPGRDIERWQNNYARARSRKQKLPEPPVCLSYIVHYADNSKAEAKVQWQQHIGQWNDQNPLPLPHADLGWVGKQSNGAKNAVWVMKWDNPHPGKTISKIDIKAARANTGAAAVFAISTGTLIK